MKLYNVDRNEWREGNFKRGDSWRSDVVYRCGFCCTKTNRWIMGGWPGTGPRILCPGDMYKEHDELESAVKQRYRLKKKTQDFEKTLRKSSDINRKKAQVMIDHLHAQKELLTAKIDRLREHFSGKVDDVKGIGPDATVEEFYPSSKYDCEKESVKKVK